MKFRREGLNITKYNKGPKIHKHTNLFNWEEWECEENYICNETIKNSGPGSWTYVCKYL